MSYYPKNSLAVLFCSDKVYSKLKMQIIGAVAKELRIAEFQIGSEVKRDLGTHATRKNVSHSMI